MSAPQTGHEPTSLEEPNALAIARRSVTVYFLLLGIGVNSWLSRIPDVKASLDLSARDLGLILMAGAVGTVSAIGPTGRQAAIHGSRPIIRWTGLGFALALVLIGIADRPLVLAVALFLFGASSAALDVAMNAHGVTVEKAMGRAIMSRFHATYSIGALVAVGIGGTLAQLRVPVLAHLCAAALVVAVATLVAFPHLLPAAADRHDFESDGPRGRWPAVLWLIGALGFFAALGEGAAGDWSAVHLREELGASPFLAALPLAAFSVTMVIGRLVGDHLTTRFRRDRLLLACGMVSGIGLGAGLFTQTAWGAIVGWAFAGAGLSVVIPVLWSTAGRLPGLPQAHALAAVTGITYSGFIAGPPLIGFVAEVTGVGSSLLIVVVLCLLIAALSRVATRPVGATSA